jgi:hypothetical protein
MDEQDIQGSQERWATQVFEACRGRCSNCGSDDRLRVEMIVPETAGGRKLVSNGTLLCRTCTLAREIGERRPYPASGEHTRPINFFVSRGLHNKLGNGLATDNGFRSVSSLVRFLMTRFVGDPDRFDDLEMFQDPGSDVKINVWVDRDIYDRFKAIADRMGMTVTDALKGLIKLYEVQTESVMQRRTEP